ncbi:60S ribosomal protein L17B [Trifolium repens]|nr:60S ribosomal protein L17B [Trifolium repens]
MRFRGEPLCDADQKECFSLGLSGQDIDMERLNKLAAFQKKVFKVPSFVTYMSSPCHIELILSEKEEAVQKEPETQLATNKKSQALRSGPSS